MAWQGPRWARYDDTQTVTSERIGLQRIPFKEADRLLAQRPLDFTPCTLHVIRDAQSTPINAVHSEQNADPCSADSGVSLQSITGHEQ